MTVGGTAANVGVFKDADSRFEKGMIVGKAHETDESYVVTSHGLYPIRKIIRLPRGQQRDSTWNTNDKSKPGREKLARPQIIEASAASPHGGQKDAPQDVGARVEEATTEAVAADGRDAVSPAPGVQPKPSERAKPAKPAKPARPSERAEPASSSAEKKQAHQPDSPQDEMVKLQDGRTPDMLRMASSWEDSMRDEKKRKAEGQFEPDETPEFPSAPADIGPSDVSVGAVNVPHLNEPEELYQEWDQDDEHDWSAEGSDMDPGIRLGQEVEIPNQCDFGVYELQLRSSQNWNNYKWLNVRWVLQKRGHVWWCRLVARDSKALNPEAPGLFTCASFLMAGRMIGFYAVNHPVYGMMVGIIVQDELVICEAPEEVKQMERDAGSDDDAVVTLNENLYGERSPPIRFEEISSGSQINEFGFEMRYPQPQRTAKVMLDCTRKVFSLQSRRKN